jgi:uncharacterized protein (TIGR03437 family)
MERNSGSCGRLGAFCAIFALLASTNLHAQSVVLIPQNQITVGDNPDAFVIADLEGNGQPDLVVANQGSSTVSVLRGMGGGFFQPLPNLTTGISPRAVVVADFNGDGILDLAVANFASNDVSVLLGKGDGTFRLFASLNVLGPSSIAMADFNGDGKLDLAVVATNSRSVAIFLGKGDGNFLPFFTAAVGEQPVFVTTADFNGDGKLDLAVVNTNSNNVSILLGIGNGMFQRAANFDAGQHPTFAVVADFNGDGKIDLAVANPSGFSTSTISVFLGLGDGAFVAPITLAAGPYASFLLTGDFNQDGKVDLAVANTGSNTISIFSGLGNGYFMLPQDFVVGSAPVWIGVADLNTDGEPDLLVANSGSNYVSVLTNHTVVLNQPAVTSIVNAASFQTGPVAPGELVTIFGSNLGPSRPAELQLTASKLVATTLSQTQVLFDGIPAPLLYVSSGQVSAIVPYGLAGHTNTQLVVTNDGKVSAALTIAVTNSAPALFTANSTGKGQGAILNQDGSLNSALNPAAKGSAIVLYATGAGETNPNGVDGLIAGSVLPKPVLPVSATIDGIAATVAYAGAAPGLVAGIMQVNVQIPDGVSSGVVPVVLKVGASTSPSGVTLSVR